jgi:hypothetical protein
MKMNYPDGQEIRVGDRISIDRGQRMGRVEIVVNTPNLRNDFYLDPDEDGIFVEFDFYGRVLIPSDSFLHDEISLIARE